jgi:hypothetical protein
VDAAEKKNLSSLRPSSTLDKLNRSFNHTARALYLSRSASSVENVDSICLFSAAPPPCNLS